MLKYAEMVYGPNQIETHQYGNLGDWFQTYAMDYIYKSISIQDDLIVRIDRNRLSSYSGEACILPMQGWFGRVGGIETYPLSSHITPVYLGYHSVDPRHYSSLAVKTIKGHEPVCCRDEATCEMMRRKGIRAYLTGCTTVVFPKRSEQKKGTKVFLVDAPSGIEDYMPDYLKDNIEYLTQEVPYLSKSFDDEVARLDSLAKKQLKRYSDEARLVITSRLHCAGPCLGMGIPVILARKYFDERYGWIEKYLPLYTPDRFSQIDWDPTPPDMTWIKQELINLAKALLIDGGGGQSEEIMRAIDSYYRSRAKAHLATPFYVKAYHLIHGRYPRMADFIREKMLQKYTIATGREKSPK